MGLTKNENPLQGSFIIEELTDLVEEAIYAEFDRLTDRGGVLGAMETMYQRSKIQEESLYYEHRKMTGELPIIGVNTFLAEDPDAAGTPAEVELIRSTESEKQQQIRNQQAWKKYHEQAASEALAKLEHCAAHGGNVFVELMETARVASLGQMSRSLYRVGGSYRRSM